MPTLADKKRNRFQEMFSLWHSSARGSHDPAHADRLHALQEDGVITSPKVYESGIITRLDLRLVDLYGDCAIESGDTTAVSAAHESVS